jgi:hypothetical protein
VSVALEAFIAVLVQDAAHAAAVHFRFWHWHWEL